MPRHSQISGTSRAGLSEINLGGGAHTFAVDGKTRWRFDAGLHFTIPWHEQALQLAVGAAAPPVPVPKLGEASGVYERISLGGCRTKHRDARVEQLLLLEDERWRRRCGGRCCRLAAG